jgi:hypothetical protein
MKRNILRISWFLLLVITVLACKKDKETPSISFQLTQAKAGNIILNGSGSNVNIPYDGLISLIFSADIDQTSYTSSILLKTSNQSIVPVQSYFGSDYKTIVIKPISNLQYFTTYILEITSELRGAAGETFPGTSFTFTTQNGKLKINTITINGQALSPQTPLKNVNFNSANVQIKFSHPLDTNGAKNLFSFSSNNQFTCIYADSNKTVNISNILPFHYYQTYSFSISSQLKAANGFTFSGYLASFSTSLDSSLKFPLMPDDDLLNLIEQKTFKYFYDFAHPASGMIRERNSSGDIVTTGGSGFGIMALIVGIHRGFISRSQGMTRLATMLNFLETCDRYHGAWPHWLNGSSGATVPFTANDNGADLVETSFMVEGLITMKQYLNPADPTENQLRNRIITMVNQVEWDWFTRNQNVLYWHWSPNLGWVMNMKIVGYNESLITYVMAAASTTHTISAAVYHQGYAQNGNIQNGNSYYGYPLPLGSAYGGPLFFTHYSFLGLDPRNLSDNYANYWTQNVNQSMINWAYCNANPKHHVGYSSSSWGLTASDNPWGYNAHSPTNDLGVITPTAAVSAIAYTPVQSMAAIRHFYYILGDKLWGQYGFYDAFDANEGWWADSYLAIDQGPIICMIENHRSSLLWDLFMSDPDVQNGLTKLGFTY